MKIFKGLIIISTLFLIINCKKGSIVSVSEIAAEWDNYIKTKSTDKTLDKDGFIYPKVTIEFKKITEKKLYSFKCQFNYNYAGKYFGKEEIISFDYESEEIKSLNNGNTITVNFKYPKVKKIVLKENEEFFIPLHGVIAQSEIIEIKHIK